MNEEQPLISCIVPIYNSAKYLHRCIDSILAQDYINIEIILVDDGSLDDSPIICDIYSQSYHNIIVKHIPNGGASLARKEGLKLAKGEYITFVDSDDFILNNYISSMFLAIKKFSTDIAGCNFQTVINGDKVKECVQSSLKLLNENELLSRFFNYEFWALWGGLYRKKIFDEIKFPKATISEDYYIKCQMFMHNSQMAYVDAPLYIYEIHENSLSRTKLSKKAFEEFENTLSVYNLILNLKPEYEQMSLKNVIETCVKLIMAGDTDKRHLYISEYYYINDFLRKKSFKIVFNRYLNTKVKIISILLIYFPSFLFYIKNKLWCPK